MDRRTISRWAAPVLFLLASWALFFWPILFDGRVPVYRDIIETTVPLGHYIGSRLRNFELPQWFPFEGLGEPFIGQLNESTFHPTSWLYAVLPLTAALRWELLLGYLAAAFGQLLLARRLGASLPAAAMAGVVFAFSGYAISLSNVLPYLWGMAALPFIGLCSVEVFERERPWPWVGALALCWATVVLAGDSHSAIFGGFVVLVVGLVVKGRWPRLLLCLLAAALAIGIAGAELLPAIDIVRAGPRATWVGAEKTRFLSSIWSLHPYRLPELVFRGWMPLRTLLYVSYVRYRENGVWALSIYACAPVLLLAVLGLWGRTRLGVVSAVSALVALWLALGYHGGLEPLLRRALPVLNLLRYPEKHLSVWTFGLSLAAAAGLDFLRARPRWTAVVVLAVAAAGPAIAGLALPPQAALRLWPQLASTEHVAALQHAWRAGLIDAGLSLAACAAILVLARRRPAAIALLPAVVLLELWLANGATISTAPAELLTWNPRFCAVARTLGAGPEGERVLVGSYRPVDDLTNPPRWAAVSRNLLQPDSGELCGIGTIYTYPILSNEPRIVRRMAGHHALELNPALRLFGVGLRTFEPRHEKLGPEETVVDELDIEGEHLVLSRRTAAPRAYAAAPRWVPDLDAAIHDLEQNVGTLATSPSLVGSGPRFAAGPVGSVRIESYAPERVVLQAHLDRDGAVILNDLHSPGWTARLDGSAVPIYLANALVRGVVVPAGDHRIEMVYRLPRLRAGLWTSGASLLLCAAAVVAGRRRRDARA